MAIDNGYHIVVFIVKYKKALKGNNNLSFINFLNLFKSQLNFPSCRTISLTDRSLFIHKRIEYLTEIALRKQTLPAMIT